MRVKAPPGLRFDLKVGFTERIAANLAAPFGIVYRGTNGELSTEIQRASSIAGRIVVYRGPDRRLSRYATIVYRDTKGAEKLFSINGLRILSTALTRARFLTLFF